jgi:hypothetical protein
MKRRRQLKSIIVKKIVKTKIAAAMTALGTPHPKQVMPLRWAMTQATNGCAPKALKVRTITQTWYPWA